MNQKMFGSTIAALRKKRGMTQSALAQELNVSDKAVSKWENGFGYPEITLLPKIASVFGVTVDYLLGRAHTATPDDLAEDVGEKVSLSLQEKLLVQMYRQLSYTEQQELHKQIQKAFAKSRKKK